MHRDRNFLNCRQASHGGKVSSKGNTKDAGSPTSAHSEAGAGRALRELTSDDLVSLFGPLFLISQQK